MIQEGLDFVHIRNGEEMFIALAEYGKDVEFLRYWGEGHSILSSQNQRHMWARVFNFLKDNGVAPNIKE